MSDPLPWEFFLMGLEAAYLRGRGRGRGRRTLGCRLVWLTHYRHWAGTHHFHCFPYPHCTLHFLPYHNACILTPLECHLYHRHGTFTLPPFVPDSEAGEEPEPTLCCGRRNISCPFACPFHKHWWNRPFSYPWCLPRNTGRHLLKRPSTTDS